MKSNQAKFSQCSMWNTLGGIPDRQLNWLINSWAFAFRMFIYPVIDPSMFDCLYSNEPSRPAAPPQVLVSLIIIGAMFNKTDEEMYNWMMDGALSVRLACNTANVPLNELPINHNALSRFRERNRAYAEAHGGYNPLEACLEQMQWAMWSFMGLPMTNLRVDSMQISANIAYMSREVLVYSVNQRALSYLVQQHGDSLKERIEEADLGHYFEMYDSNRVIYHAHVPVAEKREKLASEASKILELCEPVDMKGEPIVLFTRTLSEQTVIENGKRRFSEKDDHTMHSEILQNPSDPLATLRNKAFQRYIGYVLNVVEAVGTQGSQVISWDFERNVVTDPVMTMAFINNANTIVEGVKKYNELLGIENPGNMEKCLDVLRARKDEVVRMLRELRNEGRRIPRTSEFGIPVHDSASSETMGGDNFQQIDIDGLLEGLGVFTMDVHVETNGSTADTMSPAAPVTSGEPAPTVSDFAKKAFSGCNSTLANNDPTTSTAPAVATENTKPVEEPAKEPVKEPTVEQAKELTKEEQGKAKVLPMPRLIFVQNHAYIDGIPLEEYIKKPEFADLDAGIRAEAIMAYVRMQTTGNLNVLNLENRTFAAADGAYSVPELVEAAAKKGIVILPTDLFGSKPVPILALYTFKIANGETKVDVCPMGKSPLEQKVYANGTVRVQMHCSDCKGCPFVNDCKAQWQPRKETYAFTIAPNAQARTLTAALIRSDMYKDVGRFRNGVETVPAFLRNVLDIDHLPIGMLVKKTYVAAKIAAFNVWKFFLAFQGKSCIQANPLLA